MNNTHRMFRVYGVLLLTLILQSNSVLAAENYFVTTSKPIRFSTSGTQSSSGSGAAVAIDDLPECTVDVAAFMTPASDTSSGFVFCTGNEFVADWDVTGGIDVDVGVASASFEGTTRGKAGVLVDVKASAGTIDATLDYDAKIEVDALDWFNARNNADGGWMELKLTPVLVDGSYESEFPEIRLAVDLVLELYARVALEGCGFGFCDSTSATLLDFNLEDDFAAIAPNPQRLFGFNADGNYNLEILPLVTTVLGGGQLVAETALDPQSELEINKDYDPDDPKKPKDSKAFKAAKVGGALALALEFGARRPDLDISGELNSNNVVTGELGDLFIEGTLDIDQVVTLLLGLPSLGYDISIPGVVDQKIEIFDLDISALIGAKQSLTLDPNIIPVLSVRNAFGSSLDSLIRTKDDSSDGTWSESSLLLSHRILDFTDEMLLEVFFDPNWTDIIIDVTFEVLSSLTNDTDLIGNFDLDITALSAMGDFNFGPALNESIRLLDSNLEIDLFEKTFDLDTPCETTGDCKLSLALIDEDGIWVSPSGSWSQASGWESGTVPFTSQDVYQVSDTQLNLDVQSPLLTKIGALTVSENATLEISGARQLQVFGDFNNEGTISIQGQNSILEIGLRDEPWQGTFDSTGTIFVGTGASFSMDSSLMFEDFEVSAYNDHFKGFFYATFRDVFFSSPDLLHDMYVDSDAAHTLWMQRVDIYHGGSISILGKPTWRTQSINCMASEYEPSERCPVSSGAEDFTLFSFPPRLNGIELRGGYFRSSYLPAGNDPADDANYVLTSGLTIAEGAGLGADWLALDSGNKEFANHGVARMQEIYLADSRLRNTGLFEIEEAKSRQRVLQGSPSRRTDSAFELSPGLKCFSTTDRGVSALKGTGSFTTEFDTLIYKNEQSFADFLTGKACVVLNEGTLFTETSRTLIDVGIFENTGIVEVRPVEFDIRSPLCLVEEQDGTCPQTAPPGLLFTGNTEVPQGGSWIVASELIPAQDTINGPQAAFYQDANLMLWDSQWDNFASTGVLSAIDLTLEGPNSNVLFKMGVGDANPTGIEEILYRIGPNASLTLANRDYAVTRLNSFNDLLVDGRLILADGSLNAGNVVLSATGSIEGSGFLDEVQAAYSSEILLDQGQLNIQSITGGNLVVRGDGHLDVGQPGVDSMMVTEHGSIHILNPHYSVSGLLDHNLYLHGDKLDKVEGSGSDLHSADRFLVSVFENTGPISSFIRTISDAGLSIDGAFHENSDAIIRLNNLETIQYGLLRVGATEPLELDQTDLVVSTRVSLEKPVFVSGGIVELDSSLYKVLQNDGSYEDVLVQAKLYINALTIDGTGSLSGAGVIAGPYQSDQRGALRADGFIQPLNGQLTFERLNISPAGLLPGGSVIDVFGDASVMLDNSQVTGVSAVFGSASSLFTNGDSGLIGLDMLLDGVARIGNACLRFRDGPVDSASGEDLSNWVQIDGCLQRNSLFTMDSVNLSNTGFLRIDQGALNYIDSTITNTSLESFDVNGDVLYTSPAAIHVGHMASFDMAFGKISGGHLTIGDRLRSGGSFQGAGELTGVAIEVLPGAKFKASGGNFLVRSPEKPFINRGQIQVSETATLNMIAARLVGGGLIDVDGYANIELAGKERSDFGIQVSDTGVLTFNRSVSANARNLHVDGRLVTPFLSAMSSNFSGNGELVADVVIGAGSELHLVSSPGKEPLRVTGDMLVQEGAEVRIAQSSFMQTGLSVSGDLIVEGDLIFVPDSLSVDPVSFNNLLTLAMFQVGGRFEVDLDKVFIETAAGRVALSLTDDQFSGICSNLLDPAANSDSDQLNNSTEMQLGTNPCAEDTDLDLVNDDADNCPLVANTDQANVDMDNAGNACDFDDDNDGLADVNDPFPLNPNLPIRALDLDGDGLIDSIADIDGDGIIDSEDDNIDGDELDNALEALIGTNPRRPDSDNNGVGDLQSAFLSLQPEDIPGTYLSLGPVGVLEDPETWLGYPDFDSHEFRSDGTGTRVNGSHSEPFTWLVNTTLGTLDITYSQPLSVVKNLDIQALNAADVVHSAYPDILRGTEFGNDASKVRVELTENSSRWYLVTVADETRDFVRRSEVSVRVIDDLYAALAPAILGVTPNPTGDLVTLGQSTLLAYDDSRNAGVANIPISLMAPSKHVLPISTGSSIRPEAAYFDVIDTATGTLTFLDIVGGIERLEPVAWQLVDGRLKIQEQTSGNSHTLTILSEYEFGGLMLSESSVMVNGVATSKTGVGLHALNVAPGEFPAEFYNRYLMSGLVLSSPFSNDNDGAVTREGSYGFYISGDGVAASGIATNIIGSDFNTAMPAPTDLTRYRFYWSREGNSFTLESRGGPGGVGGLNLYAECELADEGCSSAFTINWQVVGQTGNRVYVLEVASFDPIPRLNFFELYRLEEDADDDLILNIAEVDSDGDGVANNLDSCPLIADDQFDLEHDGIGDACDRDDDNDGISDIADSTPRGTDTDGDGEIDSIDLDDDGDLVPDRDDKFPLDATESQDNDGDGTGDNQDDDDDNDLVLDIDDNCPLIANQDQSDVDGDGVGDVCDSINLDEIPPVITGTPVLVVESEGLLTDVEFDVVATDNVDGEVVVIPGRTGPFRPGLHQIVWTSVDSSGNQSEFNQTLHVEPLIGIPRALIVPEGKSINLVVRLNGPAPVYPVTVTYTVEGSADAQDHDLVAGTFQIASGLTGTLPINVTSDSLVEGTEEIKIKLTAATGAVIGEHAEVEIRITEANLPPRAELKMKQGTRDTRLIQQTGDQVVVSLEAEDPEEAPLTVDWSRTSSDVLLASTQSDTELQFDPGLLLEGNYFVAVSVSDGGHTVNRKFGFRVITAIPALSDIKDSDGDGISDFAEGSGDDDGDGIPDYEDGISDPTQLQGGETEGEVLQTEPGLKLKLGTAALFGSRNSARVTQDTLNQFGGGDGGAGMNASDSHDYPLGVFDFEVAELPIFGESVSVVIPLQGAIPANAVYRKYSADIGWNNFVLDGKNDVASALASQVGACPTVGNVAYTSGLTAGNNCVQLTIEDGGPNDADGAADGKVLDPGGVATAGVEGDSDGDGVADELDAFPNDAAESVDTDGDGTGDNADTNDDGDSALDVDDAFPLDASETLDTDGDGIGDNADIGIRLGAGQTIELPVVGKTLTSASGGTLTIPSGATAVSINVTAVTPSSAGFVTVWPCGVTRPLASNLNFVAGDVRPNGVIAPVGTAGSVCLYSLSEVDLIVDVAGWFVGNAFTGATPQRLVDTRDGTGGQLGKLAPDAPLTIAVTNLPVTSALGASTSIPSSIDAVALNVTVVNPDAAGFITVYPCDVTRPLSSNVNYSAGQVVANGVISPVSADGTVCVYSLVPSDVVIDLAGWLPTSSPSSFTGVTPKRLVDTRDGTGGQQGQLTPPAQLSVAVHGAAVSVAGTTISIPTTATAAAFNVTIVNPQGAGFATVWPCSVERPLASNLNFAAGDVVANNVVAPIDSNGEVCFYTNVPSDIIVDIAGYFSGTGADAFVGSTPKRFLDTRDGTGPRGQ